MCFIEILQQSKDNLNAVHKLPISKKFWIHRNRGKKQQTANPPLDFRDQIKR
jgi:hypothetical protein